MATLTMNHKCVQEKKKKVTFKRTQANHRIKALLKDLYTQVAGKDTKTSEKLELALASLSKYPLEITSGEDCFILRGFDKNLCRYVDEQLFQKDIEMAAKYDTPGSSLDPIYMEIPEQFEQMNLVTKNSEVQERENNIHDDFSDPYVADYLKSDHGAVCPTSSNNEYDAVVVALYCQQKEFPSRPELTRKELILKAKQYCLEPIDNWGFVKYLEKKHMVIKSEMRDGVEVYSLTATGIDVGGQVLSTRMREMIANTKEMDKNDKLNDRCLSRKEGVLIYEHTSILPPKVSLNLVQNNYPLFIDMPPGTYEVVMLVDKNEPKSLCDLEKNVKTESRSLKVGDIVWVARSKTHSQELVLPYIIERKRMDDFAASIKDGRFHEQKFRLRKCGLRNVIYLVEDHKGYKHCGLSMATLNQAKVNTRVQDGFLIQCTDSLRSTKRFLNMMTLRLTSELEGVHLRGTNTNARGKDLMTFEYFNALSSKTKPLTVKETFIKMLVQLKGLSVEKALAITKVYSSPKALIDAYANCDAKTGELLLANLRFNSITPKVSPAISKIVYKFFTTKEFKT